MGSTVAVVSSHGQPNKRSKVSPRSTGEHPAAPSCYRCGNTSHRANDLNCPARSAVCRRCTKTGHFSRVCKSSVKSTTGEVPQKPNFRNRKDIRTIEVSDIETDEVYNVFCLASSVSHSKVSKHVYINGNRVESICDTGAEISVLPINCLPNVKYVDTNISLKAWGNFPLTVLGITTCKVSYKNCSVRCKFLVVDVDTDKPLLSYDVCKSLGLLYELATVSAEYSEREPITDTVISSCSDKNAQLINRDWFTSNSELCTSSNVDFTCTCAYDFSKFTDNADVIDVLRQYQKVFSEGGTLRNIEYKVELRDDAKPFAPPARRLPPGILPAVQAELNRLQKEGIIEEIEEPTEWCAPMVVALKKDKSVRLCTDLRVLNKNVKRHQYQMPTLDEISARLHGSSVFSKVDLQSGFQQMPIAEESQKILAFSSPFGRFKHRRLPQGITAATEVFQKYMDTLLSGISNVVCYMDDCLIFGKDIESHNKTLKIVLSRLLDNGVRLNLGKSVFAKAEVEFIGHRWSKAGIAPSAEKLKAIENMPKPSTCEELRSFLGLAAYVGSRTVPHFSTKASSLWELGSTGQISWNEKLSAEFYDLKNSLLHSQRLQYFDPSKPVIVQVDASGQGLGGVILQEDKPVIFVSRKLTSTEQKYSQIEREFLSIVFTLTRLRTYLLGIAFTVQTDHKPLLAIIKKPIDKVSNRLQRWILNIQHFDFTLEHTYCWEIEFDS